MCFQFMTRQEGCDKVYISTSDVQMHANYHRKDSAIIQEGFQRYRATEDCATSYCAFSGQRTTHFHCRRTGCTYTFKNKADMGKLLIRFDILRRKVLFYAQIGHVGGQYTTTTTKMTQLALIPSSHFFFFFCTNKKTKKKCPFQWKAIKGDQRGARCRPI